MSSSPIKPNNTPVATTTHLAGSASKDAHKNKMPTLRPAANYGNNQRLNSWPPTQIRFVRGSHMHEAEGEATEGDGDVPLLDRDLDLAYIDEDPLTYFLTPAPSLGDQDGDGDLDMMDFDAGIEDASHPPAIVRSVSPSSLDGGTSSGGVRRLTGAFRPPTPPRSPPAHLAPDSADSTTDDDDDDDDDDEDYIRLGPNFRLPSPPFSLRDFASLKARKDARHAAASAATDALLSASFPPGPVASHSIHGRSSSRFGGGPGSSPRRGRAYLGGGASFRRRLSPHSWREPSPDVWSIEEVPEEDADTQKSEIVTGKAENGLVDDGASTEVAPAKPKKRVRFVLPVQEELHY